MPKPRLVFDGAEDVINRELEWCEVGLLSSGLREVPWGLFIDCAGSSIMILLEKADCGFGFSSLSPLWKNDRLRSESRPRCGFFLDPKEDVSHLDDFVLH